MKIAEVDFQLVIALAKFSADVVTADIAVDRKRAVDGCARVYYSFCMYLCSFYSFVTMGKSSYSVTASASGRCFLVILVELNEIFGNRELSLCFYAGLCMEVCLVSLNTDHYG